MSATLTPSPFMQFFDITGAPLAGGLLYTYAASTSTPQDTYTDASGTIANTNPIVLNTRGEAAIWLGMSANYKFVLKDSVGVLIWTADNIEGLVGAADLAASTGSSLIGYIAAGSGAVATTVQAKLRESVSVQDFGADPTGGVDATAAINAALAASKTVNFGDASSTYKVSGTLTVQTGSTLIFNGATVTMTAQQKEMFDVTGTTGVTISGGKFVGFADSPFINTAASKSSCVAGSSPVTNLAVRNNTFTGFCYSPLNIKNGGENIEFIDNFVTGPGVAVLGAPTAGNRNCTGVTIIGNGVTVRGNTIQNTAQGMIIGQESTDVVIDGNIIKNTLVEHGIYCDTGIQRLTISNNLIHNTCGMGMKVQWYDDPTVPQVPSDITIVGNVIQNTGTAAPFTSGDGILVYNVGPIVVGGTISNITAAATAVFTTTSSHGLAVGDNIQISGVAAPGMISIQSQKVITAATSANPGVFTAAAHGLVAGSTITFTGLAGGTWSTLNSPAYFTVSATGLTANDFQLLTVGITPIPLDTSALGVYTASSGTETVYNSVANTVNDFFVVNTTPSLTTFTVKNYTGSVFNTTTFSAYVSGGTVTKATYANNVTITGNSVRNINQDGISLRYVKNAVVSGNVIDTVGRIGLYGLIVGNIDFVSNNVSNTQYNGASVYAPMYPCSVKNNTFINPGAAGLNTSGYSSGIILDSNGGGDCSYNTVLGDISELKMFYGIQLASGDKRNYSITNNIVQHAESGGIVLWNDTPNIYPLRMMANNISEASTVIPGWQNSYGGLPTAIPGRGNSTRDFFGLAAPTTGTWVQGDKIWAEFPAAGSIMGWTCVSGGTPGTWYPFGGMQTANAYTVAGAGLPDRALNTADAVGAVATVLGTLINDLKASGVLQ